MAELSITGTSTQGESGIQEEDGDFEPSVDMLVHDFDDEQTLEEEEMLQGETNFSAEIDDLAREGEMPIHELLKMYGYGGADSAEEDDRGTDEQRVLECDWSSTAQGKKDEPQGVVRCGQGDDSHSSSDDSAYCSRILGTAQLICPEPGSYFDGNDAGESEDEDYIPCEEWQKEVMVGPMYQVETPAGLCKYQDNEKAYENDDQLLWNPELLPEKEVVEFLAEVSKRIQEEAGEESREASDQTLPERPLIKDNEQALYELVKCNFNREEALKRLKFNIKPVKEELPLWSEEERQDILQVDEACGNDLKCVQVNKQIKLWRRKPSLPHGGTEPADGLLGEAERSEVSQAVAPPAGCSRRSSTTHSCEDSQSSAKLLACSSDRPPDNSHTNGSSRVPGLTTPDAGFHSSSDPDTSSLSGGAVNRLARRREEDEGSERPVKKPKLDLHPAAPATGTMEAV